MKIYSLLILFLMVSSVHAGELQPLGDPSSTMKNLDLIEPRTPLVPNDTTIKINAPGSYYLTGNLTVQDADGIKINENHVTLDLNGFTISGNDSSDGINTNVKDVIVIKNGKIKGFTRGINALGSNIVMINHIEVRNSSFQGIGEIGGDTIIANSRFTNNAAGGFMSIDRKHVLVHDSSFIDNNTRGIDLNSNGEERGTLIKNCVAFNNGGDDIQIENGLVTQSIYQTIDEEGETNIFDSKQIMP